MPFQTILAILTIVAIGMTAIAGVAFGAAAAIVVAVCTLPAYGIAFAQAVRTARSTR